ncbi:MAG TPA: hypothetical protein VFS42_07135 [Burkholderiaceae bacterium]|nr:hypothetical protein [Burkholderiaceae bacterium]
MCLIVRQLVLWMLVLSLPIQAVAATAGLHCTPAHREFSNTQAHQQHEHSAHHVHEATSGKHLAGKVKLDKRCSACAMCCLGVAIVPKTSLLVVPSLASYAYPSFILANLVDHIGDGLDRPPKTLLV